MYNQRILEVEHGSFTPLVFSATGGYGREGKNFYRRFAEMMVEKEGTTYPLYINRKINFALLRSILCAFVVAALFREHFDQNKNFDIRTSEQLVNMNIQ